MDIILASCLLQPEVLGWVLLIYIVYKFNFQTIFMYLLGIIRDYKDKNELHFFIQNLSMSHQLV